jgi:hypothetical protein
LRFPQIAADFSVDYRQFEKEFLRLAFTTDIELSASALAFVTDIPIADAEKYLRRLVDQGTLELGSDSDGNLKYEMPDRPQRPLRLDHPALVGSQVVSTEIIAELGAASRALVARRVQPVALTKAKPTTGQAMVPLVLNAALCPGLGSMVGGKTGVGIAQLALFLVGLPLVALTVGLPLIIGSWMWGLATGGQLALEATGR